ncbi:Type II secretion system protein OS=Planctomyces limnophilus (strain ATCC 43296 / DSM 3776 / IFAM 1008 / 290) GN=Plim_1294 PE=4 SV=1: T2SF: T2SF [Gemmataceae bacterium]|nr:Type II secretion system protein OS=Planctomyces limnophilus (strain ATCC 43296 / DSM 3776 / IFAM 1008 / 290) GN=Plim_1294 PE=4 SV=1: T2SF: T2SF [Gemmataceae bacterium]VTU01733.1 Type II secretion system protein OS=Planctomyces limnophilus (strain ATCC 43296 / DSM 3776 / IFAM 1008 / 290) GN=Plim_1294 PE=4 SV=1: T2SF: T2SF [Gemmataceae bacterium]
MFASQQFPLAALVTWCQTLRHSLAAGLSPVRIFKLQGKSGPRALREVAKEVAEKLEGGDSLEDALEPYRNRFPPLFLELVAVGERTGRLEDTFAELQDYFESALTVQRNFRARMTYPLIQYCAAVFIIAALTWVLGFLAQTGKAATTDPLGTGLTGTTGAVMILVIGYGLLGGVIGLVNLAKNNVAWRARLEGMLLMVPAWGPAARAFAVQRFAVALRMCAEAGLRAEKTMRYCFRATCNSAFLRGEPWAVAVVKKGNEISEALEASGAPFPEEFHEMVRMGEETGNTSEVMERLTVRYREEAERKLKTAAEFTGYLIYGAVALGIIYAIFKIAGIYLGALNDAAR